VHSLVRSMFNKAIDWGWYEGRNPARAAKRDGTDGVVHFQKRSGKAGRPNCQTSSLPRSTGQSTSTLRATLGANSRTASMTAEKRSDL
jgi:hypothetical protein